MEQTWTPDTDKILNQMWGYYSHVEIAKSINDYLLAYYQGKGNKSWPITSSLGVRCRAEQLDLCPYEPSKLTVPEYYQEVRDFSSTKTIKPRLKIWPIIDLVYFVFDPFMDLIKIGKTKDLNRRFRELQIRWGDNLRVLGTMKGYTELEFVLHLVFDKYRCKFVSHREWFFAEKPLYFFIAHFCDLSNRANSNC